MTALEIYAAAREELRVAEQKLWKAVEVEKRARAKFRIAKEGLRADEREMWNENVELLAS